jgi:Ca2+-binding RTX toxin-like protein
LKFYNRGRVGNKNQQPVVDYALVLVMVFGFAVLFNYIDDMKETNAQSPTITATTADNTSSLSINRNSPQPQHLANSTAGSLENFIMGSFGNDRISGTPRNNIIVALDGSDSIHGLGGDDKIQGNEGADQLYGEAGNDVVQGGTGSDQLYGGDGDDIIAGGVDDDYLVGGQGDDKLYGDVGDDILVGEPGSDYFDCGDGVDVVIDFNLTEGDDSAGNCEEIQNGR